MQSQVDDAIPEPEAVPEEHSVLAAWARFCGEPLTLAGVRASLAGGGYRPAEVRAALDAARGLIKDPSVDPDLPLSTVLPDAGDLLEEWLEEVDGRELEIVRHRIMRPERTLEDIGEEHGVTRERIRQQEARIRRDLAGRLQEPGWVTVQWAVQQLARAVGSWVPLRRLSGFDPEDDAAQLVAHLAGLHVDAEQGVLRRAGFQLPDAAVLRFEEPEGVVLDERHAHTVLRAAGIRRAVHDSALEEMGMGRVHRVWVRWDSGYVERAVAVLAVRREPMSAEDLARIVGAHSMKSLRDRLQGHPMTQRVTRGTVGLRSWGMEEYTGVVDLMTRAIEEEGGPVSVADLAERLETTYGVRPGTVNAYSSAPAFVAKLGMVRMRREDEPYQVPTDPSGVAGLQVREDGLTVFDVPVVHDVLRGSGRSAPEPLGGLLGLAPGEEQAFAARREDGGGEATVVVSWPAASHTGPQLGSLRPLAQDLDAQEGDLLRLTFDGDASVVTYARVRDEDGARAPH